MEDQKGLNKHNIVIAGLTAAGKTTHARLTVAEFGFGYVSASTILREKAGFKDEPPSDFWLSAEGQALSRRIIELGIDEALQKAEDARDETVFDCRSLPWLVTHPILSIWLESSLESRVWKAIISQGKDCRRTVDEIRYEVIGKDERDRDNLLRTFGFDLFRDHEPMDVIVDLSTLITAPTIHASWRSIRVGQDIISAAVGLYLTRNDFYRVRLRQLQRQLGPPVFRRFSRHFGQLLAG